MKAFKYGCGIDISKDKLDACLGLISVEKGFEKLSTLQFDNTPAGFKKYMAWVQKHCKAPLPLVHLMEATGIYYEHLALHLGR
jgi:transposase